MLTPLILAMSSITHNLRKYLKVVTLFSLLEKIVAGSIQHQPRIVGRACYFDRIGQVIHPQRVVDQICWYGHNIYLFIFHCPNFLGILFLAWIFWAIKIISGLPGFLWHVNPTCLGLQSYAILEVMGVGQWT